MTRRAAAVALILIAPLTLAAADPTGDAVPCRGTHGGGDPPDLVGAVGQANEGGSSAIWRLTFAQTVRVPDPTGAPFRVDVVIRDPNVPTVSLGNYRTFNRIVRFDATGPHEQVRLLFVTEGGSTVFDPPTIDGNTMTIEMPGRLLLGADEFGPSAMRRLRWTVIVRDGGRCDVLGDGSTSQRLVSASSASPSAAPEPLPGNGGSSSVVMAVGVIAIAGAILWIVLRRRR